MATRPRQVRIICLNESVAHSLRSVGLEVLPSSGASLDRQVYDLAPAIYLHSPSGVVAFPHVCMEKADLELLDAFETAMAEAHAPPILRSEPLPRKLKESIAVGLVLGLVFLERVPVDDRLARLRYVDWDTHKRADARHKAAGPRSHGGRGSAGPYDWRKELAPTREDVLRPPTDQYAGEILKGLLFPRLPPLDGSQDAGLRLREERTPMAIDRATSLWAADLLPAGGLSVRVVVLPHDDHDRLSKQTLSEAIAQSYSVSPGEVRVMPLFVNALGEWLGVAARIGKGAVLILPEFPDKVAVVKRLATELWTPIQEWIQASGNRAVQVANEAGHGEGQQPGTRSKGTVIPTTGQGPTQPESVVPAKPGSQDPKSGIPDCWFMANSYYEYALGQNPDLKESTWKEIYGWLVAQKDDSWHHFPGKCETFARYVRDHRKAKKLPPHRCRDHREGTASIRRQGEV